MKKIIILIKIFIVIILFNLNIISCKEKKEFKRFNIPKINYQIKKWIISEIKGEKNNINYSFNDLFKKLDLEKIAKRLIEKNISKYFYNNEEKNRAKYTEIINNKKNIKINENIINNQIIKFIKEISLEKLYSDYLKGIHNKSYFEIKIAKKGYLPDYQTINWFIQGITSDFLDENNKDNINWNTFKKNKKYLINKENKKFKENFYIIDKKSELEGFEKLEENQKKIALKIRFNDYYIHSIIPEIIDDVLITATYLHQNQFKLYSNNNNKIIYINKYNPLFNNMQDLDDNNNNWKTYIKMVWKIKIEKNKLSNEKLKEIINDIKIINENANENNKDLILNKLKYIFNEDIGIKINKSDPFFGIKGYEGMLGFNKIDNNLFANTENNDENNDDFLNENNNIIEDIKKQNKAGILISDSNLLENNIERYLYFSSFLNKKYSTIIFVLPIYLIDLLNNLNLNYSNDKNNNKKIEMKYFGTNGILINDLNIQWINQGLSVKWLYNQKGYLGTHDENGKNLYNDDSNNDLLLNNNKEINEEVLYNDNENMLKNNLLKTIEYIMGKNKNLQKAAKNNLYSLAFNYNLKNIYYNKLYEEIKSFIKDKK